MRRSLERTAARVERLAAEHVVDEPAPAPDDPHFMVWAVQHYGLARLLTDVWEREVRHTPPSRRRRA